MNGIMALFSALGLSTAAGLNAYIPLLVIGALDRYAPQLVNLSGPFELISNPWLMLAVGVLAVLDFVGDKIPAVDHAVHAVGLVLNPIAGAIVALAANSDAGAVNPVLIAICGLLVAGGVHTVRATVRPAATLTTGGVGNPILSLIEDAIALVLSGLAVLLPVLAFLLVLVLAWLVVWFLRRIGWGRRKAGGR
ncbi:MAG: DUF4126 domain-containing protein [Roseiflexaceae bacterium]|nr:DUF4126 domain-containing protein [Roseiflexaceae bacterium]